MSCQPLVLLVDDDAICLSIMKAMLEQLGYSVITAQDGCEAIEVFQQHKTAIFCIILDVQMPRMNGIQAFKQMRKIQRDVRVIFISGAIYHTEKMQMELLNPLAWLEKPISFDHLSEILVKYIQETSPQIWSADS